MLRKCSKNYRILFGRTPLLSAALLSILTAQTAYSVTCTDTDPYFTTYDCAGGASITAADLPITLSITGSSALKVLRITPLVLIPAIMQAMHYISLRIGVSSSFTTFMALSLQVKQMVFMPTVLAVHYYKL